MNRKPATAHRSTRDYWIVREDQVRCLASARRQDMVDRLAAGGPLSVRELAATIGMKPSALYHHLSPLLDVGLVVEAGSRLVNRRREKLYDTPSSRMRLLRALSRPATRPLMKDTVTALCRQMDRDFANGIGSPAAAAEGAARNLGFFRLVGRPGKGALVRINEHLAAIGDILWNENDPRSPLVALAWTFTPLLHSDPATRAPKAKRK